MSFDDKRVMGRWYVQLTQAQQILTGVLAEADKISEQDPEGDLTTADHVGYELDLIIDDLGNTIADLDKALKREAR